MSERPSIDRVLRVWLAKCGVDTPSKSSGKIYKSIPRTERLSAMRNLTETLLAVGYSKEELQSGVLANKVAAVCWHDNVAYTIGKTALAKSRKDCAEQWYTIVDAYDDLEIVQFTGKVKVEPDPLKSAFKGLTELKEKKELNPEDIFNPKDRLFSPQKIERQANHELLAELGLEEDFKNE